MFMCKKKEFIDKYELVLGLRVYELGLGVMGYELSLGFIS